MTDHAYLEALQALNAEYIRSVQHGDVKRFGEILADDFLCSNPDGSLFDKRRFLEQAARPATISGSEARDIQIRLLGEVAIIHARTSYRTAAAKRATAVTPTSGRGAAGAGSRSRRTSRADDAGAQITLNAPRPRTATVRASKAQMRGPR